jgi:hypothetical protein
MEAVGYGGCILKNISCVLSCMPVLSTYLYQVILFCKAYADGGNILFSASRQQYIFLFFNLPLNW